MSEKQADCGLNFQLAFPWETPWAPWDIRASLSLAFSSAFLSSTARLLHVGNSAGSVETHPAQGRGQPGSADTSFGSLDAQFVARYNTHISFRSRWFTTKGRLTGRCTLPASSTARRMPLTKLHGDLQGYRKGRTLAL